MQRDANGADVFCCVGDCPTVIASSRPILIVLQKPEIQSFSIFTKSLNELNKAIVCQGSSWGMERSTTYLKPCKSSSQCEAKLEHSSAWANNAVLEVQTLASAKAVSDRCRSLPTNAESPTRVRDVGRPRLVKRALWTARKMASEHEGPYDSLRDLFDNRYISHRSLSC